MPRGGKNNLSDAIRKALGVFGADSDREKSKQIKDWIKSNYPALTKKVDDKTFGSALSTQRKKVSEGGAAGPQAPAEAAPRPAPKAAPASGVRSKASSGVDVSAFVDAVKDLQELGKKVGGKENLRRLLDLLP
jgi:hypothetical protein